MGQDSKRCPFPRTGKRLCVGTLYCPASLCLPTVTDPERLATLVRCLTDSAWTPAPVLARTLGVSPRTVYRDVQKLRHAGVPLRAAPGRGYRLREGSRLPPLLLTPDEAALLLGGAIRAERAADARLRMAARTARQKLEALVPDAKGMSTPHAGLDAAPPVVFSGPEAALIETLRAAVAASRALRFVTDGRTVTFHPYALVKGSGAWRLVGRDVARRSVASYRADRLLAPELLDEDFTRPAAYAALPPDVRDIEVRVRFSAAAARLLQAQPAPHLEKLEVEKSGATATFLVQHVEEMMPWLLSWGSHARVLDPSALVQRLRQEAERMARAYAPATPLLFS